MKYWIYIAGDVPGQYEPEDLVKLPGFYNKALVCPADSQPTDRRWQPAEALPDIARVLKAEPSPGSTDEKSRPSEAIGIEDLLDETNLRLFRHISQLMKDVEVHREERRLLSSVQQELTHTRNALKEAQNKLAQIEKSLQVAEENAEEARQEARESALGRSTAEQAFTKALYENEDLAKKVDSLNRLLADKQSALSKSLSTLSRAEQELEKIVSPMTSEQAPFPVIEATAPTPIATPPVVPMELFDILRENYPPKTEEPPKTESPARLPAPVPPPWTDAFDRTLTLLRKHFSPRR